MLDSGAHAPACCPAPAPARAGPRRRRPGRPGPARLRALRRHPPPPRLRPAAHRGAAPLRRRQPPDGPDDVLPAAVSLPRPEPAAGDRAADRRGAPRGPVPPRPRRPPGPGLHLGADLHPGPPHPGHRSHAPRARACGTAWRCSAAGWWSWWPPPPSSSTGCRRCRCSGFPWRSSSPPASGGGAGALDAVAFAACVFLTVQASLYTTAMLLAVARRSSPRCSGPRVAERGAARRGAGSSRAPPPPRGCASLILWPWLQHRADVAVYASPEFAAEKSWGVALPRGPAHQPPGVAAGAPPPTGTGSSRGSPSSSPPRARWPCSLADRLRRRAEAPAAESRRRPFVVSGRIVLVSLALLARDRDLVRGVGTSSASRGWRPTSSCGSRWRPGPTASPSGRPPGRRTPPACASSPAPRRSPRFSGSSSASAARSGGPPSPSRSSRASSAPSRASSTRSGRCGSSSASSSRRAGRRWWRLVLVLERGLRGRHRAWAPGPRRGGPGGGPGGARSRPTPAR